MTCWQCFMNKLNFFFQIAGTFGINVASVGTTYLWHRVMLSYQLFNRLGLLSCFMNILTFCISGPFTASVIVWRFIIEGRNETCRSLNLTVMDLSRKNMSHLLFLYERYVMDTLFNKIISCEIFLIIWTCFFRTGREVVFRLQGNSFLAPVT